jgi:hypothetical protein
MTLDTWLRIISTISTVLIGLAAFFIAYQQFKISRSKLKFDLYERRLKLFNVVKDFCGQTAMKGRIETAESSALYHDTIERHFLFEQAISAYIGEVYERAKQLQRTQLELERPRLADEEKTALDKQVVAQLSWFYDQAENIMRVFSPELSIKTLK